MKTIAISGIVFCMLASEAIAVEIPKTAMPAENKSQPVASAQQTPPSASSAITQSFVAKGVLSCAARINQVTDFVGAGGSVGAFLFLPPNAPDQRLVSGSLEVVGKDNNSVYSSVSFAPNQANGCGAVYDAIEWWPQKCDAVAKSHFPGQKATGVIKKNISVLSLNQSTRIFLMPAGDGCISIKKEVVSQ